jgi:hypothetical protein
MPSTHSPRRLPGVWITLINDRYYKAPDRNAWADFNCSYQAYQSLSKFVTQPLGKGIYDDGDVPLPPVIADFPDLEKSRNCIR